MKCKECNSTKLVEINSKASDLHHVSIPSINYEKEGYLPNYLGVGGGDYVNFVYCLDCGQIQGDFPKELPQFKYCPDCGNKIAVNGKDDEDLIQCEGCLYEDDYDKFLNQPPKTEEEKEKENIEPLKNVTKDDSFWQ